MNNDKTELSYHALSGEMDSCLTIAKYNSPSYLIMNSDKRELSYHALSGEMEVVLLLPDKIHRVISS